MSVVNQMLNDLEKNQADTHLNFDVEKVGDSDTHRQSSPKKPLFFFSVIALLLAILLFQFDFIQNNFSEKNTSTLLLSQASGLDDAQLSEVSPTSNKTSAPAKAAVTEGSFSKTINRTQTTSLVNDGAGLESEASPVIQTKSEALEKAKAQLEDDVGPENKVSLENNVALVKQEEPAKKKEQIESSQLREGKPISRVVTQNTARSSIDQSSISKAKKQTIVNNNVKTSEQGAQPENLAIKSRSSGQQLQERIAQAERAIDKQQYVGAINLLKSILQDHPNNHRARELLAFGYIQNQQNSELESLLASAIVRYPSQISYRQLLARHYMQLNQWEKVVNLISQSKVARQSEALLIMQAIAHQKLSQHLLAIEVYGSLLKNNNKRGDWWIGLAVSLEGVGRYRDANQALVKASKDPRISQQQALYIQQKSSQLRGLF